MPQVVHYDICFFSNEDTVKLTKNSIGLPTTTEDGTDLVIRADSVLSLGAPKVGLLAALVRSLAYEKWNTFVVDIGISNIAWRKMGTRQSRSGVDFGNEWVVTLRYHAGVE